MAAPLPPLRLADSFDRPNATSLGRTPTGNRPWRVLHGSPYISSGMAFFKNHEHRSMAVVDAGVADVEAGLSFQPGGSQALFFRVQDYNNWWRLRFHHPAYSKSRRGRYYRVVVEKCVRGRITIVASTNDKIGSVTYSQMRVRATGRAILAYTNVSTTPFATIYDPYLSSRTEHGIGRGGEEDDEHTTGGMDDFYVGPLNAAPNAPPLDFPKGGVAIDLTRRNRFRFGYSDPDPGDTQSAADLRWRRVGDTDWVEHHIVGPFGYFDVDPGTFSVGDYEWQARSYDSHGLAGSYSSSAFFHAGVTPTDVVLLEPFDGQRLADTTVTAEWATGAQDGFQLVVLGDLNGAANPADIVVPLVERVDPNARSHSFGLTQNNRVLHVRLRTSLGPLWSDWEDARVVTSFTAPLRAQLTIVENNPESAITVIAEHHAPEQGAPDVVSINVWRRNVLNPTDMRRLLVTGWPATEPFTDFDVRSGVDYEYMVESVGANGAVSQSAWLERNVTTAAGTDAPGTVSATVTATV